MHSAHLRRVVRLGVLGLLVECFATALFGINAQVINGTSNQSLSVTYDLNSVLVGSPVTVHVVGSVSGNSYEFGGNYNRSWEGGNANFTLNPNGIWGYTLAGQTSIDRWMTITPNQAGTYRVGLMLSSFPSYEQAHAYIDFDAYTLNSVITSATSVSRNQGQDAAYTIQASNSPTSFGASGLPNAATLNAATGVISGRLNVSGVVTSTITASNAQGGDSKTLTWSIVAASVNPSSQVTPTQTSLGNAVSLIRAGTANFGIGWTENVIWKPGGGYDNLGTLANGGTLSYTATAPGVYNYQFRLVDVYGNYADRWISFTITGIPAPTGFQTTRVTASTVSLTWSAVSGASGYNIYRNGVKLNASLLTGTSFVDYSAVAGTSYAYQVRAIGTDNSEASANLAVTTRDPLVVFMPTGL